MKPRTSLTIAILALGFAVGCKSMGPEYPLDTKNTRNKTDDSFLVLAMSYDLAASDIAGAILSASADTDVKVFAYNILDDTRADMEKLRSLALGAVKLPEECNQSHVAAKAAITKLNGQSRDSAYAQYQLTIYNKSVELFNNESQNGQFKNVTGYAADRLPYLLSEQEAADSILHKF